MSELSNHELAMYEEARRAGMNQAIRRAWRYGFLVGVWACFWILIGAKMLNEDRVLGGILCLVAALPALVLILVGTAGRNS